MATKSNVQLVRKVRPKKPKTTPKERRPRISDYGILDHKNNIYLVRYPNGSYYVEFKNKSLGCTLKGTDNKKEAQDFYKKVSTMSKSQILHLLNNL